MKKYLSILEKAPLFNGIAPDNLEVMLKCLGYKIKKYKKNEFIVQFQSEVVSIGIVLSGFAQIIKEDFNGNLAIMEKLSSGGSFSEAIVCSGLKESPVAVSAITDVEILFLPFDRIITTCSSACGFHSRLIQNMMKLIASKNILLNTKLDLLTKRTTREKLLAFFYLQKKEFGINKFKIRFSRNELADFLSVNRSAMSRELCNMRDEGFLNFHKNEFEILKLEN